LEVERRFSNVILKEVSQVDVKNVHDCNQLTICHSIKDVDYNVISFWYFHIGHLYIHDGDNMFWSLLRPFVKINKLLLVLNFFKDDQITHVLELVGWLKLTISYVYSNDKR